LFAALALVGGGYMVRDLTDTERDAVEASSSPVAPSASTSLPSGTTPAVSGGGLEPVADVAAAVGPAVVQIQVNDGRESGLGSGTIYDAEGYILTNAHVVGQSQTVRVILADGTSYDGDVLGTYEAVDIAVVDIDADIDLPVARLAADEPRVGQTAVALGSPFGLDQTVTAGIVSAVDRAVPSGSGGAVNMIQTDAPINPGNSGGALANLSGEIIAVPSQIFSETGENNGIGFGIPIETAKRIADKIVNGDPLARAGLGVQGQDGEDAPGAVVAVVTPGGGAAAAGLQAGDRITSVNEDTVRTVSELQGTIGTYSPGDTVTVTFVRDGRTQTVEVTLGQI
jgi:S1-C subfamily serine protease